MVGEWFQSGSPSLWRKRWKKIKIKINKQQQEEEEGEEGEREREREEKRAEIIWRYTF